MSASFDPRIVPPTTLRVLQVCQRRVPFHLGGGAALAGLYLRHRLSRDADMFFHSREAQREMVRLLPEVAAETGVSIRLLRDAGSFVRAELEGLDPPVALDIVYDAVPDVGTPSEPIQGVTLESLEDLRANKLTCLLSRAEPRDLVDVLFLERAGFLPEIDLPLALRKDAGIDPGVLAWLLQDFPLEPLPQMLEPLTTDELRAYRSKLAERFRQLTIPE